LVFMDIHMPVMDGLEASARIFDMGCGVPVIAMTANVMSNDKEVYAMSGMADHIGKPFTSQELWRCLLKYFKPIKWQEIDKERSRQIDSELRKKLIKNFLEINKEKYSEITNAINAGDLTLAHRMAHTLASNAGQLDKDNLQKTAEDIENRLKDGKNLVTPELMEKFKDELNDALAEFAKEEPGGNTEKQDVGVEESEGSTEDTAENLATDPAEDENTMKTVLLVDDDSSSLLELAHLLRSDYKVRAVRDGIKALKSANSSTPDIILLDVVMPEMSGFEVLEELKKTDATKDIPVIMITGKKDNVSESEGFELGAADYIRKPFNSEDVIQRVKNHLEIAKIQEKDW